VGHILDLLDRDRIRARGIRELRGRRDGDRAREQRGDRQETGEHLAHGDSPRCRWTERIWSAIWGVRWSAGGASWRGADRPRWDSKLRPDVGVGGRLWTRGMIVDET